MYAIEAWLLGAVNNGEYAINILIGVVKAWAGTSARY
jgi:hypothetical protein